MRSARRSRWALSFADLCLLLLGFFVLLEAGQQRSRAAAIEGLNRYFGKRQGEASTAPTTFRAVDLFVPGEAMLTPAGRSRIATVAKGFSGNMVAIGSHGGQAGTTGPMARFDGWDLASARLGAVARALAADGVAPAKIRIIGPDGRPGGDKGPPVITLNRE